MSNNHDIPIVKIAPKIQERLKECIQTNPVTIVLGPTGCGKSTQVPSFLLDTIGGPIVCTQPRRLAVVAVATRVAQQRNTTLGGPEVGYHVGQSNHTTSQTKLAFTTAGILLEELRAHGIQALTKYKAVVLDECHERSPEQELCLAFCKLFLQNKKASSKIRLVLMSATFDHARYKLYFSNVSTTDIDTITLETANMVDISYKNVKTLYLEDTVRMLDDNSDSSNSHRFSRFYQNMLVDPDAELQGDDGGKSLSFDLLSFLRTLVLYLDKEEPLSGVFVIFAPTYRHLEQIYDMLSHASDNVYDKTWKLGVLHSSVDMEDCLRNMQPNNDSSDNQINHSENVRKILLASAIADSSVTIPGVTCVIDLCRALQVKWNTKQKVHIAKTTWASQSICNQRQGRTGRTCPGRCFRLVTKFWFISRLDQWEEPLLALSSCRNEALKLLCLASSNNSSSSNPNKILSNCLDPPKNDVVVDAFVYLQSIGACVPQGKKKGSFVPTKMGELLAALPFAVEDSQIIVAGAQIGLLYETLAMRAIMSHKPSPIVHHFGDATINEANIMCYYRQAPFGTAESVNMANLSAFLYWDVKWNQQRSKATAEYFAICTGSSSAFSKKVRGFIGSQFDVTVSSCNVWNWCPVLDKAHTEWCRSRGINPTSVRGVADLIDNALNVFYMSGLEPDWLRSSDPTPLWRRLEVWKGKQMDDAANTRHVLAMVYGSHGEKRLSRTLMALSDDSTNAVQKMSKNDILDIASLSLNRPVRSINEQVQPPTQAVCVHFLEGKCIFGSKCRNSHSPQAVRPLCRFFANGGCMRGDRCAFSHEDSTSNNISGTNTINANLSRNPLASFLPKLSSLEPPEYIVDWFEERHDRLLLLGEGNFEFTNSLKILGLHPYYATDKGADPVNIGKTTILGIDATRLHLNQEVWHEVSIGNLDSFHWNFPFTGVEENDDANEDLILGTFHSLLDILRTLLTQKTTKNFELTFSLTLQGDQFSRWNILRSAMRTGWRLAVWGVFQYDDFPGDYKPRRVDGEPFPVKSPRFYEFKIHSDHLKLGRLNHIIYGLRD